MARRPTLATFIRAVQRIENWPEVVSLRLGIGQRDLSLLSFRDGITMAVRRRSMDWDVVRDLFLQRGYGRSFRYLRSIDHDATAIDLGGNIGAFSLRAAAHNQRLMIHAYEPGPPNIRMFELNCLANPHLAHRIELHKEAAGAVTRTTQWYFNEANAGGSSLYGSGEGISVQVRAFADVIECVRGPIAMVKIDIEGAEYELLRATPPAVWDRIPALSIEMHRDPEHCETADDLLKRFHDLGFMSESDGRFAVFLRKRDSPHANSR